MQANTQGWHVAQWGAWGWLETILKLVALAAGILAALRAVGELVIGGNPHLAAVILLVILSLGAVYQLYGRWKQKETISFVFAIINLLGHLGLLFALLHVPNPRTLPIIFGVFYALGQAVKVQFLRVTGYTEFGANTRSMIQIAVAQGVIYLVFAILVFV